MKLTEENVPYFTFIARTHHRDSQAMRKRDETRSMGQNRNCARRETFLWSVASGEACIASSHPAAPTAYVRLSPQCTASLLPTQCCCCSFYASLISPILFSSPPTHREIASS